MNRQTPVVESTPSTRSPGVHAWLAVAAGLAALFFSLATINLTNDQFGRISPAWQIAKYGELPFRDFLDPGYYLTELSSAALLRLFGDNLLGEWLLTSAFMAGGTVVVLLLSFRVSQSCLIAVTAAAVSLLSLPRAYDYDKVLFYPLGLLLSWRYIDHGNARQLWMLAAGLLLSALFRYDTGVYIACAAFTVIAVRHAGDWLTVARRAGLVGAAVSCLALPFLMVLEYHGGVRNAVDQIVSYGQRETARTQISSSPRISTGALAGVAPLEPPARIFVRWATSVDEQSRKALESQYQLREAAHNDEPTNRTWSYQAGDSSVANLRRLVQDPRVEDTHGIDRVRLRLASDTLLVRLRRQIPALRWRVLPGAWTFDNANAFLYYLLRWMPLLASVILLIGVRSGTPWSRSDSVHVSSLIVMCVLLNIFILREPVNARVGGMAGPVTVLGAWMAKRGWDLRWGVARGVLTLGMVTVLVVTLWSLSATMEWDRRLQRETFSVAHLRDAAAIFSASPPSLRALPSGHLSEMVNYLRECTGPNERVLALWFVPELYFFAQRGFVGSVATFGGHWSEPRFQKRIVNAFTSHSVPIVLVETRRYDNVIEEYPLLGQYLGEHYVDAGTTSFGDPGGDYTLLVDRTRVPVRTHPASKMPCF